MTITYIEETNSIGQIVIRRNNEDDTISTIPLDPANSDYQEYLKSLEVSE
jgi:hypothetical protein